MSELKEIRSIVKELSDVNDHLDQLVRMVKSYDKEWFESGCDKPIVFGLMGHKEHVDDKIHELSQLLTKLETNQQLSE